ncbi:MAG: hypothetical protein U0361_10125 [Nitrospiraceae bacterium]
MKKRITTRSRCSHEGAQTYPWPATSGNSFIERAVILSSGSDLFVPMAELKRPTQLQRAPVATLEAAEREHVLKALREATGSSAARENHCKQRAPPPSSQRCKLGISRPA